MAAGRTRPASRSTERLGASPVGGGAPPQRLQRLQRLRPPAVNAVKVDLLERCLLGTWGSQWESWSGEL